jgi:hypothetical protein
MISIEIDIAAKNAARDNARLIELISESLYSKTHALFLKYCKIDLI